MSSIAWKFFTVNESDADYAVCKLCKKLIKRGNTPRTYATSPLLKHLAKIMRNSFLKLKIHSHQTRKQPVRLQLQKKER